jgi:hypothetical protein
MELRRFLDWIVSGFNILVFSFPSQREVWFIAFLKFTVIIEFLYFEAQRLSSSECVLGN